MVSPTNLCYNLNKKSQERKPRSPNIAPQDEFEKYMSTINFDKEKEKFPLLYGESRIKTIIKYLSFELFTYPELRKMLRERYIKKLVINTNPTNKGIQDIDLYSQFFPVKRIR